MSAPEARARRPAPSLVSGLAAAALAFLPACISGPPMLAPPPAHVETLDGFGSLSLRGAGGSLRGRFSFFLSLFRTKGASKSWTRSAGRSPC